MSCFCSEPVLEDPTERRPVTDSDGSTGSNAGLVLASSASAGNDLLITRLPSESQQGFKGETGSVDLPAGGRPAVPHPPSEGCVQGGGGIKRADNSASGETHASGNGKILL